VLSGLPGFFDRFLGFRSSFELPIRKINCGGSQLFIVDTPVSLHVLASLILFYAKSGYRTIIVPGFTLRSFISEVVSNEGIEVLSYDDLRVETIRGGVILVYPEVYLRTRGSSLSDLTNLVSNITCRYGGVIISRALTSYISEYFRLKVSLTYSYAGLSEDLLSRELIEGFTLVYRGFKPSKGQVLAFKLLPAILNRGGTLIVVMPTGSGKSSIFQVASRIAALNGLGSYTLVVSPLRALMREHVFKAERLGLKAYYIDSTVPIKARGEVLESIRRGFADLLYISPERFLDPAIREFISYNQPSLIVLDEVHTILEWGYTFRPAYAYMAKVLASIRANNFKPPILALTATVSKRGLTDISRILGHSSEPLIIEINSVDIDSYSLPREFKPEKPIVLKSSPIRDNIEFNIIASPQGYKRLEILADIVKSRVEYCRSLGEPWVGVIFTSYAIGNIAKWANVKTIGEYIERKVDVKVLLYHGRLGDRERRSIEDIMARRLHREAIIVSTKAFGMGIDIPNIRWTVHYVISDSIEELYQEVGRSGRDGRKAYATILYNPSDIDLKLSLVNPLKPSFTLRVYNTLVAIRDNLDNNNRYIILPLGVFKREKLAIRALEILRSIGLLDYHIVSRGTLRLSESPEGEYYMRVGESNYIVLSSSGHNNIHYKACFNNPIYNPVTILYDSKILLSTSSRCLGPWVNVGDNSRLLIIETIGDIDKIATLPYELFKQHIREFTLRELKLEKLRELIEEALTSLNQDSILKSRLVEYFEESERLFSDDRIDDIIGKRVECRGDCYDKIARIIARIEKILGYKGLTVYYDMLETWDNIASKYSEIFKKPLRARRERFSKLKALISYYGLEKILDKGFIVLTLKGKNIDNIVSQLEDYKYFTAILIDD